MSVAEMTSGVNRCRQKRFSMNVPNNSSVAASGFNVVSSTPLRTRLKNDLLEMPRDQSNMICTMEPLQPTSGFGRVSPHDTLQATVRTQGFGANAFSNENLAHRTQPVDTNQDPW